VPMVARATVPSGARRDLGVAPRQKKAIATDDIRAAVLTLDNKTERCQCRGR